MLGYTFAIIASLCITAYVIPKKISKLSPIMYCLYMGFGFFVTSIMVFGFNKITNEALKETLLDPRLLLSGIGGVIWTVGFVFFLTAIERIGISKANQWKNLQGPIGAILILLFLSEFIQIKISFIFLAIISMFISAMLFTVKNDDKNIIDKTGIFYGVFSAIFFGINPLIQKYMTNIGYMYAQQVYFSGFVFLFSLIYVISRKENIKKLFNIINRDNILAIISGGIFFCVSIFSTLAYKYIPGSIAFTIVQLNAIWTIFIGIFIFKEINLKKHWLRILVGILFSILGIIMLLYAQK